MVKPPALATARNEGDLLAKFKYSRKTIHFHHYRLKKPNFTTKKFLITSENFCSKAQNQLLTKA